MFVAVLVFARLWNGDVDIDVFGQKVLPRIFGVMVVGIIFTWAGIALAIWARWHLGQYWSGWIRIKQNHKLIRTGPYARLRHPIYSGLDLAVIGSTLVIDRWRCVAGACIIILGFWVKAKREEALLSARFGAEFEEHRRHTGFLFPRLKVSS
jgi:protein-S-isoprenylcysteine O-methyltransferase Ste14